MATKPRRRWARPPARAAASADRPGRTSVTRKQAYLDYNASAPLRPEAEAAVTRVLRQPGNASSVHGCGRAVRRAVEDAREAVAALVNAAPAEVVFTGGGTEANNTVLTGSGARRRYVSAGEHDSVRHAAPDAALIPLDRDGIVDAAWLATALARDEAPALVSVMLANNETGVVQPLDEVVEIARRHGALVHCDAVQAAGKIPTDCAALGVDFLTLSAHKLGGPQGVGALIVRGDAPVAPLLRGGGQERRRRAGTENAAGIAGFGAAARAARDDHTGPMLRIAAWRDALEAHVRAIAPEAVVLGEAAPRLPNTSCIAVPGLAAESQVMALDLEGVAIGAGSACSSGKVEPSHVLQAMGCSADVARAAIRVSLGWASEAADVDRFVTAWETLYRRVAAARPAAE